VSWIGRFFAARRPGSDAHGSVERALLASLSGDADAAEAELSTLGRERPADVDVFRALALVWSRRGEFLRSIHLHQALLLRRDLPEGVRVCVLADLADDFRRAGFLKRALAAYEEVLIHEPRHARALAGLAALLRTLRDHERALEVVRRLGRVEGRDTREQEADLHLAIAEAAHAEGRADAARRSVKRALRLRPEYGPAFVLLGTLEAERGKDARALAAWCRAAELDPRCGSLVYPRLEAAFAAAGRTREIAAFLRGLLEKRPDDASARIALARALAAWGEVDAAVAELRSGIERGGDVVASRAELCRLLLEAGRDGDLREPLRSLLDALEHASPPRALETSA
jgi:lipopolysaccharide biosynthesis regulator YciM